MSINDQWKNDTASGSNERRRVDSLNQQPQARSSSFVSDTQTPIANRAGSIRQAHSPSILEEASVQDGVCINTLHKMQA